MRPRPRLRPEQAWPTSSSWYRVSKEKNSVVVADPARGVETLSRESSASAGARLHWSCWCPRPARVRLPGRRTVRTRAYAARRLLPARTAGAAGVVAMLPLFMRSFGVAGSFFIQHWWEARSVSGEWRNMLNALGIGMVMLASLKVRCGLRGSYR